MAADRWPPHRRSIGRRRTPDGRLRAGPISVALRGERAAIPALVRRGRSSFPPLCIFRIVRLSSNSQTHAARLQREADLATLLIAGCLRPSSILAENAGHQAQRTI